MESKTIKISADNYRWLLNIASILQKQRGKTVSFDETLISLRHEKEETIAAIYKEMKDWEDASIEDQEKFFRKYKL
jgi:predicted CopG family antitoxin